MRTIIVIVAFLLHPAAVWARQDYTLQQTEDHLSFLLSSPYIRPTPSALTYDYGSDGLPDSGIGQIASGKTPGTAGGGYQWTVSSTGEVMDVPSLDMYAYRLTDFTVTQPKSAVVLVGGNHPNESRSLNSLQGMVDFLISGDPVAQSLRGGADFYIYPQVNPEGRWAPGADKTLGPTHQPEHPTEDHNRFWNNPDSPSGVHNRPWSSIQIARSAMLADTAGIPVGYVFDFHSPGDDGNNTFIFATKSDAQSDFAKAIQAQGRFEVRESRGEPGMVRIGGTSPGGLNADYGFTPEIGSQPDHNLNLYYGLGVELAKALASTMIPSSSNPDLADGARDFFWINGAQSDGTVMITGLDLDSRYVIDLVVSRSIAGSTSKASDYTINGLFADGEKSGAAFDAYIDGYLNGHVLTWHSVHPDLLGQLVILARSGDGSPGSPSSNAYINAMSMTMIPAAIVLLALGLHGVLMRRRARQSLKAERPVDPRPLHLHLPRVQQANRLDLEDQLVVVWSNLLSATPNRNSQSRSACLRFLLVIRPPPKYLAVSHDRTIR